MINFMDYDITPVRYVENAFKTSIPIENINNVKARWNKDFSDKNKPTAKQRAMTVGQLIEGLIRSMNEGYINAHSVVRVNNRNVVNLQIDNELANIII